MTQLHRITINPQQCGGRPLILHTTEVGCLGDYRPWLAFNTGESGPVDLRQELWGEMFEPLQDMAQFATAYQHRS